MRQVRIIDGAVVTEQTSAAPSHHYDEAAFSAWWDTFNEWIDPSVREFAREVAHAAWIAGQTSNMRNDT